MQIRDYQEFEYGAIGLQFALKVIMVGGFVGLLVASSADQVVLAWVCAGLMMLAIIGLGFISLPTNRSTEAGFTTPGFLEGIAFFVICAIFVRMMVRDTTDAWLVFGMIAAGWFWYTFDQKARQQSAMDLKPAGTSTERGSASTAFAAILFGVACLAVIVMSIAVGVHS